MASRSTSTEQVINIHQQDENNEEEKNIMVAQQPIQRWPPPVDIPVSETYETQESRLKERSIDDLRDGLTISSSLEAPPYRIEESKRDMLR